MEIKINKHNYLTYRLTPWDTKIFEIKTSEILNIKYENSKNLMLLLQLFEKKNNTNNIKFTYVRIDASNKYLKKILQDLGFYYAETSQLLVLNNLQKQNFNLIYKNDFKLIIPKNEDYEQIREIAKNAFNFSRFHEDYNIEEKKARMRYFFWIDNLINNNKKFLTYKIKNKVISFMAFEVKGSEVQLILGGSDVEHGFVSPYFWSSLLTHFKNQGHKRIKNVIVSASNVQILNLYLSLNFKIEKTLIGFHKFYK